MKIDGAGGPAHQAGDFLGAFELPDTVLQNDDEKTLEATRSRKRCGAAALRLKARIGPRGFIHRGAGEIKARKATASVAENHGHAKQRKADMQSKQATCSHHVTPLRGEKPNSSPQCCGERRASEP